MRFRAPPLELPGLACSVVRADPPSWRGCHLFDDVVHVEDGLAAAQLVQAGTSWKGGTRHPQIECGIPEPLQVQLAQARPRSARRIDARDPDLFRDKARMKDERAAPRPSVRTQSP